MFLIPTSILAIMIILIPYVIANATILITPIIFISVIVFVLILRSKKYFPIIRKMKFFDQVATIITWSIIIPVMLVMLLFAIIISYLSEVFFYFLLWVISVTFVFVMGGEIKIKGNLPKVRCIFIYNHTSNIDDIINPIIMGMFPWKVVFEPKAQRIVYVKWVLKFIGIPLEREGKPRDKKKTSEEIKFYLGINQKEENINSKQITYNKKIKGNLLIFPEGGRLSLEERENDIMLKPFKPRTFIWAQESGLPIAFAAVDGPMNILPKRGQWWFSPQVINIHYLGVVTISQEQDAKIVAQEVWEAVESEVRLINKEKKEKEQIKDEEEIEMFKILNQASRF
jgi:1-acyl-sn-glycerol-3-phosphate acyltransferase